MKYTIDRFEGEFALVELEDGKTAEIPRIALPGQAKEGDIISIIIEAAETDVRKAAIEEKIEKLFKD